MQQTEKYKLNLIETGDTFSPHPLNENMEKVEGQLAAARAEAIAGDAALGQRLTILEAHHLACGSYVGNGAASMTFQLGFSPSAVLLHIRSTAAPFTGISLPGSPAMDSSGSRAEIIDGGFQVVGTNFTRIGYTYHYLALA